MQSFNEAIMDMMANTFVRDIERILKELRKDPTFRNVPDEFDFGIVSKFDGAGCMFKLRITGGGVTVREVAEVPSAIVCGDEQSFHKALDEILMKLAAEYASHFAVAT
jgi:hypothetical protein